MAARGGNPSWGRKGEGPTKSGNPAGRPKNFLMLSNAIRAELEKNPGKAKMIAEQLVNGAAAGDLDFIKTLIERMEGKAMAMNLVSIDDGSSAQMTKEERIARIRELQTKAAILTGNDPDTYEPPKGRAKPKKG